MIVGIHQPHFFPWIGYFDKMAKSDVFILLDEVQLEKGSYMYRNRIIDANGKVAYLTISMDKHGFLDKKFSELKIKETEIWKTKHIDAIKRAYGNCVFYEEVWKLISPAYDDISESICEFDIKTIKIIVDALGIKTKLILQSKINNMSEGKKNDLVLNLCKCVGATGYLSGNGARKYTDESTYKEAGIDLRYQSFAPPVYSQRGTEEFIPGLSIIDMMFNIGIEETKRIFWETVSNGTEFK